MCLDKCKNVKRIVHRYGKTNQETTETKEGRD